MEFKAISNGTKSVNILNEDGSIVFRVNPEYPLSRLIIDKHMNKILVDKCKIEDQLKTYKFYLTNGSYIKKIQKLLKKAGLKKVIIAINSSSMEKKTTKKLIEEEFSINKKLGNLMGDAKAKCDISEKGARIRVIIPKLKQDYWTLRANEEDIKYFIKKIKSREIEDLIEMIKTCIECGAKDVKKANLNAYNYKQLELKKYKLAEQEEFIRNEAERIAEGKSNLEHNLIMDKMNEHIGELSKELNRAKSTAKKRNWKKAKKKI